MCETEAVQAQMSGTNVGVKEALPAPRVARGSVILFIALQCLDLLSTLAVFSRGGAELNPVVRSLMPWTGRLLAIVLCKAILVSLAIPLTRRPWILRFANVLYTIVVAWNLVILWALR